MGEYALSICYQDGSHPEAEKELSELHSVGDVDESVSMLKKNLIYISTIAYTARELQLPKKRDDMRRAYHRLKRKVKIDIRRSCGEREYRGPKRVFWPSEVLDLKEVQDEIETLMKGLHSKDDPDDREMARLRIEDYDKSNPENKERALPMDVRIDNCIEGRNKVLRRWSTFLNRATEIHRKYPEAKFWLYETFS